MQEMGNPMKRSRVTGATSRKDRDHCRGRQNWPRSCKKKLHMSNTRDARRQPREISGLHTKALGHPKEELFKKKREGNRDERLCGRKEVGEGEKGPGF